MQLQKNISLKGYNTFGIDVTAEYFLCVTESNHIPELLTDSSLPQEQHIIGGGSNILLTKNQSGLTLLNQTKGIELLKEDNNHVWLKVASGEVWHELVMYAIGHGWAGIENLALIPGTVGAAPMQNIGAYGIEAKGAIESVTAWHKEQKEFITLNNNDCQFGYRDSIFKHELKGKVFITHVVFKLNKQPTFHTEYGAIKAELENMQVNELTIKAIAQAVINIRSSKLPDPKVMGNAGSFFKNPTIPAAQYEQLKQEHTQIPAYPVTDDTVKVPAGWLIEQCGFKGCTRGGTGVHEKQALVLVNRNNTTGKEVWDLSEEIVQTVHDKFDIMLEREVQIW